MDECSLLASPDILLHNGHSVVCRSLNADDDHLNDDDDLCEDRLVYFIEFDWS